MENNQAKKPIYKNVVFWIIVVLGLAAIGLGVVILLGGGDDRPAVLDGTPFGLDQPAVLRNVNITATEFDTSEGSEEAMLFPAAGNVFVGARFEVENTSGDELAISPERLFDLFADGQRVQMSAQALLVFQSEGNLLDAPLPRGGSLTGWIAMEVPEDWEVIELRVGPEWAGTVNVLFRFGSAPEAETTTQAPAEPDAQPEYPAEPGDYPAEPEYLAEPDEYPTEAEPEYPTEPGEDE